MHVPIFLETKLLLQLLYFEFDIPHTENEVRSEMDSIVIQVLHIATPQTAHNFRDKIREENH